MKKWWKNAVVYQIYPRSFKDSNGDGIGDLLGITEKLDYLKLLGVDVLWLSPVYKSPNDDNGYDISDYRDIMDEFGTMEDFDRLLAGAHERGIHIMMDLVVNHTSDEHAWFVESRKSRDNPKRDYYIWRDGGEDGSLPNRWASAFGGPAWTFDESSGQYYLHSFSVKQPDLNWDNPEVRRAVYDMMNWWCQKGIDGFRMDVISMISKPDGLPEGDELGNGLTANTSANGPRVHEYLREMNREVLSKYPLITVGECPGVDVYAARDYAGLDGSELGMIFVFEHVSGSQLAPSRFGKWDAGPMSMPELRDNLSKWQYGLEGTAWNSLYWDNHDQPRCVSRFGNDSDTWRVLSAKMLATCLHFLKGTPYIYQGEELGMTNAYMEDMADYRDIESINVYNRLTKEEGLGHDEVMGYIREVSRDNARTPMQWDDSENGGFSTGEPWIRVNENYRTINAASQVEDPDSVFHYYRRLISLRHELDVMVDGIYQQILPEHPDIFAYTRTLKKDSDLSEQDQEDRLLVLCNFTDHPVDIPDEVGELISQSKEVLICNYSENDKQAWNNAGDFADSSAKVLRPYEAIVYRSC